MNTPRLKPISLVLVLAMLTSTTPANSQTGASAPTLREKLVFGLQVRRPSEFEFIDAVVDTVERGELPRKLVERYFFFARTRPQRRSRARRPIIDFQFALKAAAEQLRIEIKRSPSSASA